jgi:outer membrane protein TolC
MKILFLLLFPFLCVAQTVSVRELIQKAEHYSPQIKGQNFNRDAAESFFKQSRLISNPVFTFQGGSLKAATLAGSVTDFTLAQPIPWPGRRQARIKSQEFLLKISELSAEEAKLQISHRIFVLSAELAALQELEGHYGERKRRFGLIQTSLRSRPQVSPKQKVDRDLIESQINIMEKVMIDLLARKQSISWELKILTNSQFDRISFPWKSLPKVLDKNNYLQSLDLSPRFKKLNIEKKLAENNIEQARLEARPDILVGVNYRQENVAPVNHFYHGQVAVVIPILDRGQHTVAAAKAEKRRTEAFHNLEKDQTYSFVHQYFAEFEASKKLIEVFQLKNLSSFEKKFFTAEESFRKGFIDALTFLQIDAQVHENIDQIYLSRVTYVSSVSNLNLLVGKKPEI